MCLAIPPKIDSIDPERRPGDRAAILSPLGGHDLDGLAGGEVAARPVAEAARCDHDGVASKVMDPLQHGVGGQTGEKLGRDAVLVTRHLLTQPGLPSLIHRAGAGHDAGTYTADAPNAAEGPTG